MFGFGPKKAEFTEQQKNLKIGEYLCLKCGEIHRRKPTHICGGPYNMIPESPDPKPSKSGMLKA